jgi:hypothetical protein
MFLGFQHDGDELLCGSDESRPTTLYIDDDGDGTIDRSPSVVADGRYVEEDIDDGQEEGPDNEGGEKLPGGDEKGKDAAVSGSVPVLGSSKGDPPDGGSALTSSTVSLDATAEEAAFQATEDATAPEARSANPGTGNASPSASPASQNEEGALLPIPLLAIAVILLAVGVTVGVFALMRLRRRQAL